MYSTHPLGDVNKLTDLVIQRGSNIYAIKALKSNDDKSFNQEVTVLRKLSSKHKHVHLITLLATYRHDTTYHLIFAWADADLYDYWRQRDEAPLEEDQIGTWVIEQCRGLADALNSVHRYATSSGTSIFKAFKLSSRMGTEESNKSTHAEAVAFDQSTRNLFGRHGDLKPGNILWYPDSSTTGGHGILKITDFGVTQFNTENMWDTRKTDKLPNSPTYRSPESDLDGRLTTACDVWALGCVYLEFVTWYFGGYKLVHWFCQRRLAPDVRIANINSDTFFMIREEAGAKTASVKPEVLKVSVEFPHPQHFAINERFIP
jgi:serine/threonine protein kinase